MYSDNSPPYEFHSTLVLTWMSVSVSPTWTQFYSSDDEGTALCEVNVA